MSDTNGNGEKRAYQWIIKTILTAVFGGGTLVGGYAVVKDRTASAAPAVVSDQTIKPVVEMHDRAISALQAKDEKHEARMEQLTTDLGEIKGDVKVIKSWALKEHRP